MKIEPFTSIGDINLGSTMDEVTELIGKPSSMKITDYGDGMLTRIIKYDELGLDLTFCEDDDFLLGSIATKSVNSTLQDKKIIGLSEEIFLFRVEAVMGEKPKLDDDFEENGKDYILDKYELSFWISEGVVSSITVFPRYDSSGNVPQWPQRG